MPGIRGFLVAEQGQDEGDDGQDQGEEGPEELEPPDDQGCGLPLPLTALGGDAA